MELNEEERQAINLIRELDKGEGTAITELNIDSGILISLLKKGEIYERKKGVLKVLE
jgi:hypothetical protein